MHTFSRREFLKTSVIVSGSLLLLPSCNSKGKNAKGDEYVIAKTTYGKVRGIRHEGVNIYKGIPYAGSVSGQYRFGRPAPLEKWSGVKDALRLGTPAMQQKNTVYGVDEPNPGEDCLFLNVWTPANDGAKRPVMFYNHGGGYATGSGGSVVQDGANLARYFDVVVVETNHRLNIFGYLYLGEVAGNDYGSSGNNGLLDIVDGLKWVHENISEFGGDPNNVMIWGESGGGMKTSCLYAMDCAAPYFHKASIESGPCISVGSVENAAMVTELLLKTLDIDRKNWRDLLTVPSQQMYEMVNELPRKAEEERTNGGPNINVSFSPILDLVAINRHPFLDGAPEISADKPLIVGWNEDEYAFFVMRGGNVDALNLPDDDFNGLEKYLEPRYGEHTKRIIETYRKSRPDATPSNIWMEVMSVTMMGNNSIRIAEAKAAQGGAPVYLYNFGYKSEVLLPGTNYPYGTPHAMDVQFKFNNVRSDNSNEDGMAGNRPERYQASLNFAELWTSFAYVGKPNGRELPEWEPYNLRTRPLMRIDSTCELIYDRYPEERILWKAIG